MVQSSEVNIKPIGFLIAIAVAQVVGMLWYSPLLFQKPWLAALSRPADFFEKAVQADPVKAMWLPWGVGIVTFAIAFYVLIHFLTFIDGGMTREGATSITFWAWLAFSALPGFSSMGWESSPINLFLVVQGHRLVSLLVAAITYVELSTAKPSKKATTKKVDADSSPVSSPRRGRSRSPRTRSARKR